MDLRDLQYFQVVARTSHMGNASEQLNLTQPALTKAIQRLEASVGAKLFSRRGRRIELTQVGILLMNRSKTALRLIDDLAHEVRSHGTGYFGNIRLGCAPTAIKYLLPQVIPKFLADYPNVTIELHAGISGTLVRDLADRKLDLIVTHMKRPLSALEARPVFADTSVIVARIDHPIFDTRPDVCELARYKWILPAESGVNPLLEELFRKAGLPGPTVQMTANSILYLPNLIAETDLLSVISRANLNGGPEASEIREVEIPGCSIKRVFWVAYTTKDDLTPAAVRLVDAMPQGVTDNSDGPDA